MTQPPENTGGRPAGDWSPDDQDAGQPAPVPPPGSWHFPQPSETQQQYGTPPPYGTSPHYGTPPRYGTPQQYGAPYGPVYPSYAAGLPAGPEPGLAEWWRRLLARVIDGLVLGVLATPIAFAFLVRAFHTYQQVLNRYPGLNEPGAHAAINRADGKFLGTWLIFGAIVAVISFLYDFIQHGLWGQTLGKRALGTRVVSARDRSKISGGTAAGRAAVYALIPVVPLIGSVFTLLDELWLLWDRRRQCLHDKAARTIVVKIRFEVPGTPQPGSPW